MFSVQFSAQSCPTLCDPHGLHHARPPCPLATPGVYSNSCPWVLLMQYFTILKFNMKDLNQSHIMCMCVCVCVCVCVVTKSFWFFCNPMDYSPPGSFVHGISQAGILEWVSIPPPVTYNNRLEITQFLLLHLYNHVPLLLLLILKPQV